MYLFADSVPNFGVKLENTDGRYQHWPALIGVGFCVLLLLGVLLVLYCKKKWHSGDINNLEHISQEESCPPHPLHVPRLHWPYIIEENKTNSYLKVGMLKMENTLCIFLMCYNINDFMQCVAKTSIE